ncbi:hypothetical protein GCM10027294_32830 [Marinactinospora endophytica]
MRKWVRTSAKTALLTAGFVALGSGISFADTEAVTSGDGSILGGNQLVVDADVPVNVSGNAVAAVAAAAAAVSEDTGAVVYDKGGKGGDDQDLTSSGDGSVAGGNQAAVDADVPVNVSGNAVAAVLATAAAVSEDTGAAVIEGGHRSTDRHHDAYRTHQLSAVEETENNLLAPLGTTGRILEHTGGVMAGVPQSVERQHQFSPSEGDAENVTGPVRAVGSVVEHAGSVMGTVAEPRTADRGITGLVDRADAAVEQTGSFLRDGRESQRGEMRHHPTTGLGGNATGPLENLLPEPAETLPKIGAHTESMLAGAAESVTHRALPEMSGLPRLGETMDMTGL